MIASARKPVTGRLVLFVLLSMFGVVILVNGIFMYFALSTHPGEIVGDAYNKGLRYNTTLADAARQQARGWRPELRFIPRGPRTGFIQLHMKRADGSPVTGLEIQAMLRRPADSAHDRMIKFFPSDPGTYRAELTVPLSGNWDINLTALRHKKRVYRLERRLWMD